MTASACRTDRVRLTEPYVTHKPKGTGLGLAIVKKIMEDHGGSLVLEDRPGGRVRVRLPRCCHPVVPTPGVPQTCRRRAAVLSVVPDGA